MSEPLLNFRDVGAVAQDPNRRLNPGSVYRNVVMHYCRRVGIKMELLGPHALRATSATNALSILRHRPEEGSAFFFAMARGIKVFLMSPGKNSKRKLALFPAAFSAAKWRRFRRANSVA
jgi:hypothetical protein